MPDVEGDQRLFFLLQRAAHHLRTHADRRCLSVAGITTAQVGALFAVREEPGITQQHLAHTLGLGEPAVTGLVTRLAKAGLLARRTHPHQHRAVALELTGDGAAALDAVQPEIDRFNGALRALLGEERFERTAAALDALAHWDPHS